MGVIIKKLALVFVSVGISIGLAIPAYAYDDAEPEVDSITFTPSVVDVTNASAEITITVRASDATDIRSVLIACTQGVKFLITADIYPNYETTDPSRQTALFLKDGSQPDIRYVSNFNLTKDQTSMTISFPVTIRSGETPGRTDCNRFAKDSLGNNGNKERIGFFTIVRDGVGGTTPTPTPTPTPTWTLTPTPTPTPTPTQNPTRLPSTPLEISPATVPRNVTSQIGIQWHGRTAGIYIWGNRSAKEAFYQFGGKRWMMSLDRRRPTVLHLPALPSKTIKLTLVRGNGVRDQFNLAQTKFSTCEEMNETFLGGVSSVNPRPEDGPLGFASTPSAYVYSLNSLLDFDQDGTACER